MSIELKFIVKHKFLINNKNLFHKRIPITHSNFLNKKKLIIKFQAKNYSPVNINKDYYRILGITPQANEKEIKNAYLNLVKKYHPDVTGGKTTEHFKEISNSFRILSDKNLKKYYDSHSEKVSKYFYNSSTASGNSENSNKTNYEDYSNGSEFHNPYRNEYYNKYKKNDYHKNREYYEEQHGNYYQDNKGNSNFYRPFYNLQIRDFINDFLIFFPKVLFVVSFYMFCYMITRKTKNEYHLFIQ